MKNQIKEFRTFKVTNIRWDGDGDDTSHLPTAKIVKVGSNAEITMDEIEEFVCNMLSNEEGWLVTSFQIEERFQK
jgi:hypothetical protein